VRRELDVVADAHRRHDHAELERELLAQHADAWQQRAALALVDERHEAVADLEFERLERQHLLDRRRLAHRRRLGHRLGRDRGILGALTQTTREQRARGTEHEERQRRQPGHDGERAEHAGRGPQRARAARELRHPWCRPCRRCSNRASPGYRPRCSR
jgi:hypothetical protein